MKHSLFAKALSLFLLTPLIALADPSAGTVTRGFDSLAGIIRSFVNGVATSLSTLFFSLALLAFFYGIVQFIWGMREGVEKKLTNGKEFMTWGLVALFVMFSVYGIVKLGQGVLFQGENLNNITIPDIKFGTGGAAGADNVGGGNKKAIGFSCTSNSECASTNCASGRCAVVSGGGSGAASAGGAATAAVAGTDCDDIAVGGVCTKLDGTSGNCRIVDGGMASCR